MAEVKAISSVRRVRTKKMPVAEAVDIVFVQSFAPTITGGRTIGIWHRHKQLEKTEKESLDSGDGIETEVVGESPTIITICQADGTLRTIPCASVEDELDFLFGVLPVAYREVTPGDAVEHFIEARITFIPVKDDAEWEATSTTQRRIRVDDKKREHRERMTKVPAKYDGLMPGDTVLAIMGGSGSAYIQALARRGREIGATVFHVAPIKVKYHRMAKYGNLDITSDGEIGLVGAVRKLSRGVKSLGEAAGNDVISLARMREELKVIEAKAEAHREEDAQHLIELYQARPQVFLPVEDFHAAFTHAGECFRLFMRTQEARKAGQLRLIANARSAMYTHPAGIYPQGGLTHYAEVLLARDVAFIALRTAEHEAKKALEKSLADPRLSRLERALREEFGFLGPRLFGALCAKVGTFARFKDEWAWNKYVGTHVNDDGTLVRRGRGLGDAIVRQEIWIMVNLMNRRTGTKWRGILDTHKANIRKIHPEKEINPETGKSRWSDIHVQKTAMWKTATDIALTIYKIGRAWEKDERQRLRESLGDGEVKAA